MRQDTKKDLQACSWKVSYERKKEVERKQDMWREDVGLVAPERAFLYEEGGEGYSDEVLSGWPLRLGESREGLRRVETFYGYQGWIWEEDLVVMDRKAYESWIGSGALRQVKNQGVFLLWDRDVTKGVICKLPRNAFLRVIEEEEPDPGKAEEDLDLSGGHRENVSDRDKWVRVSTAGGEEGYVAKGSLREPTIFLDYILDAKAGEISWFEKEARWRLEDCMEEQLREGICSAALSYLGVPYLWAGKSERGIDCSGLAFLSYLENGFLIYRDAKLMEGFPIREISAKELGRGDLVYFPGHVGIYLGKGEVIHATAYASTPCVTISPLEELKKRYGIKALGSLFPMRRGME